MDWTRSERRMMRMAWGVVIAIFFFIFGTWAGYNSPKAPAAALIEKQRQEILELRDQIERINFNKKIQFAGIPDSCLLLASGVIGYVTLSRRRRV